MRTTTQAATPNNPDHHSLTVDAVNGFQHHCALSTRVDRMTKQRKLRHPFAVPLVAALCEALDRRTDTRNGLSSISSHAPEASHVRTRSRMEPSSVAGRLMLNSPPAPLVGEALLHVDISESANQMYCTRSTAA